MAKPLPVKDILLPSEGVKALNVPFMSSTSNFMKSSEGKNRPCSDL